MKKRGQGGVPWWVAVLLISLISFAIIILFIWRAGFIGRIDKESCHFSVILRGTVPYFKDSISLRCKSKKVCITADNGCEGSGYDTTLKVKNDEELKKEISGLMYDCWWMMGEGKIDYEPKGWLRDVYCVKCGSIEFDKSVREKIGNVNQFELLEYMGKTNVPNKDITFLEYLYNTKYPQVIRAAFLNGELTDANTREKDIKNMYIRTSGEHALITGMIKEGRLNTLGNILGGAFGFIAIRVVSAALGPPGWILGGLVIGASAIGGGEAMAYVVKVKDTINIQPFFIENKAEVLRNLQCETWENV